MKSSTYIKNHNFNLSAISDLKFKKDGYDFVGWKTNLCGNVILKDKHLVNFDSDVVGISAQWNPKKYLVVYNSNYGTVVEISGNTYFHENYKLSSQTLLSTIKTNFYRNEYSISSWNIKSDGSGLSYSINGTIKIPGNTRLYAQWKKDKDLLILTNGEFVNLTDGEEIEIT